MSPVLLRHLPPHLSKSGKSCSSPPLPLTYSSSANCGKHSPRVPPNWAAPSRRSISLSFRQTVRVAALAAPSHSALAAGPRQTASSSTFKQRRCGQTLNWPSTRIAPSPARTKRSFSSAFALCGSSQQHQQQLQQQLQHQRRSAPPRPQAPPAPSSGTARRDAASAWPSPLYTGKLAPKSHPSASPLSAPSRPKLSTAASRASSLAGHLSPSSTLVASSSSPSSKSASSARDLSTASTMASKSASRYTARRVGAPNTLEYRVFIEQDGIPVSPFHDIPLFANEKEGILNMIVEVPRWTNAKMEISKEETLNPILQDTKKGKLRFVRNCFPHKGYLWNYGAFPQTWEDPNAIHPETKAKGDNDPLDVCEIGELVAKCGDVKQVKVLGIMALLDEEETDWKVIVIDVNDPLAPKLNDIEDVERHLPGLLRATNEWFRIYKIPDGKPENQFAFSGECKNKKYAMDIVRECGEAWDKLTKGQTQKGNVNLTNTTLAHSPDRVRPQDLNIPEGHNQLPAPIDPSIDKWFFISGAPSA